MRNRFYRARLTCNQEREDGYGGIEDGLQNLQELGPSRQHRGACPGIASGVQCSEREVKGEPKECKIGKVAEEVASFTW